MCDPPALRNVNARSPLSADHWVSNSSSFRGSGSSDQQLNESYHRNFRRTQKRAADRI
jgi:hypothetical protein